jgi:hypothetical protein
MTQTSNQPAPVTIDARGPRFTAGITLVSFINCITYAINLCNWFSNTCLWYRCIYWIKEISIWNYLSQACATKT